MTRRPDRASSPMAISLFAAVFACLLSCLTAAGAAIRHVGYYVYEAPPESEGRDAQSNPTPVAFSDGRLTDGSDSGPGESVVVGKGKSGGASVLFDLAADCPVERVVVDVGANPKSWHAGASVSVACRSATETKLHAVGMRLIWPGGHNGPRSLEFPLPGRAVRYIQVRMNRYMPSALELREVHIEAPRDAGPATTPGGEKPDAAAMLREAGREPQFLDRYGQFTAEEWPGKIMSDEQLSSEAEQEAERLSGVAGTGFDEYGGIEQEPSFPGTGFFQLRKIDGRWWFLTPDGHRYFMLGIDRMNPIVLTPLYAAGTQTIREAFAEPPELNPEKPGRGDFFLTNLKRKYGPDWLEKWRDIMNRRLTDWGFNGNPRWGGGGASGNVRVPFTLNVWLWSTWGKLGRSRIDRAGGGGAIDPFDPEFATRLESEQRDWVRQHKDDPWMVGWIFENENGWKPHTVARMLERTDDCPAKRAFITFLRERYDGDIKEVSGMLGVTADSFDQLHGMKIDDAKVKPEDRGDFIRLASKRYHEVVSAFIRRHDPNHLFLGSALGYLGCVEWAEASLPYVDALTFNCYSDDPDIHRAYDAFDKPRLVTEMGFSVYGRGLGGWGLSPSHRARGSKYRYLVEHLAANPCAVGIGWFQCIDNVADVGFQGVEYFNLGILSICDQPYADLVTAMRQTNRRVWGIRSGKISPVTREELKASEALDGKSHVIPGQ